MQIAVRELSHEKNVRSVKSVSFGYTSSQELSFLFEDFRLMCNDAIRICYKAAWLGLPVYYVNPRGTSSHCLCGSRVAPLPERKLYCQKCDRVWDRDDLASKNVMACAVPQARPPKRSREGEPRKQEDAGNPPSRWAVVKPDGDEPNG